MTDEEPRFLSPPVPPKQGHFIPSTQTIAAEDKRLPTDGTSAGLAVLSLLEQNQGHVESCQLDDESCQGRYKGIIQYADLVNNTNIDTLPFRGARNFIPGQLVTFEVSAGNQAINIKPRGVCTVASFAYSASLKGWLRSSSTQSDENVTETREMWELEDSISNNGQDSVGVHVDVRKDSHADQRMVQRKIVLEQLGNAVRFGRCTFQEYHKGKKKRTWVFRYKGIVYITDYSKSKPITVWFDAKDDSYVSEDRYMGPCLVKGVPRGIGLIGRPFLVTKQDFKGEFTLTGVWRFVSVSDSLNLVVRSSGVAGRPWGDATDGVNFHVFGYVGFNKGKDGIKVVDRSTGDELGGVDLPFKLAEDTRIKIVLHHSDGSIDLNVYLLSENGDETMNTEIKIKMESSAYPINGKSRVVIYNREKGRLSFLEHLSIRDQAGERLGAEERSSDVLGNLEILGTFNAEHNEENRILSSQHFTVHTDVVQLNEFNTGNTRKNTRTRDRGSRGGRGDGKGAKWKRGGGSRDGRGKGRAVGENK